MREPASGVSKGMNENHSTGLMNAKGEYEDSSQATLDQDKRAKNKGWLYLGLLPFILALFPAFMFNLPVILLAPLYGFCPLDVCHVNSAPSHEGVVVWGCASLMVSVALAVGGLFRRVYGVIFAVGMWLSTGAMLFRILDALSALH